MTAYAVNFAYDDPEDGATPHPDSPYVVEADHDDDAVSKWMDADHDYPNGSTALYLVSVEERTDSRT